MICFQYLHLKLTYLLFKIYFVAIFLIFSLDIEFEPWQSDSASVYAKNCLNVDFNYKCDCYSLLFVFYIVFVVINLIIGVTLHNLFSSAVI